MPRLIAAILALSTALFARGAPPVAHPSIAERIAAAAPGDTITIPAGTYHEHIRIDTPLTLVGDGRPVIDGGGNGDIVEINAPHVTLRGFVIRDTGIDLDKENCAIRVLAPDAVIEDNTLEDILFGVDLKSAPGSTLRNNRIGGKNLDIARRGDGIRLWRSDGCTVENNTIHDGRDAILWYSNHITVRGNTSLRCRYGFHLMYSDSVVLDANELAENSVGVYFMYSKDLTLTRNRIVNNRGPSGYGLGLKEADQFRVEDNVFAGNRVGVYIDGSPFTTTRPGVFARNTIAYNDVGITFLPSVRGNRLSENNFVDNVEQVSIQGRGQLAGNEFSASDRGNYWSDYVGYDQDRDGVGDFEHEPQHLFENMLDKEPKLRLLLYSPAQQAIEFVARAIPAVRPEPKFSDPCPLMTPVRSSADPGAAQRSTRGLTLAAGALLLIGVAISALARSGRSAGELS